MSDFIHLLTEWLIQYGSVILFLALALGIVGLPIPDETLLFIAGWLVCKGKLTLLPTVLAAIAGSMAGITMSYWLGCTTGQWLIKKWGPKFRITEEKVNWAHYWYQKVGKWTLFFGYFVPVLRHLTGYIAGSTNLEYKQFALFAYTGAAIWSCTFLFLGFCIRTKITNFLTG